MRTMIALAVSLAFAVWFFKRPECQRPCGIDDPIWHEWRRSKP